MERGTAPSIWVNSMRPCRMGIHTYVEHKTRVLNNLDKLNHACWSSWHGIQVTMLGCRVQDAFLLAFEPWSAYLQEQHNHCSDDTGAYLSTYRNQRHLSELHGHLTRWIQPVRFAKLKNTAILCPTNVLLRHARTHTWQIKTWFMSSSWAISQDNASWTPLSPQTTLWGAGWEHLRHENHKERLARILTFSEAAPVVVFLILHLRARLKGSLSGVLEIRHALELHCTVEMIIKASVICHNPIEPWRGIGYHAILCSVCGSMRTSFITHASTSCKTQILRTLIRTAVSFEPFIATGRRISGKAMHVAWYWMLEQTEIRICNTETVKSMLHTW